MIALDARHGEGADALTPFLAAGTTLVLFGPSGAGKSTLANLLTGAEAFATGDVREEDRRGRHTTTHRELVVLPSGAALIDTPGVRELALWDATDGMSAAFTDIDDLAESCRFSDCGHHGEPGCAVEAAVEDGTLDADRLGSWVKLQRELAHQARRVDARLAAEERKRWAKISRDAAKRARR